MMARKDSASSLFLLEEDNSDIFDPPPWVPGSFLRFADIRSPADEIAVWPVCVPHHDGLTSTTARSQSDNQVVLDVGVDLNEVIKMLLKKHEAI